MAIIQTIEIDGKQVPFKASAAIPRIYRLRFGRDIFVDLKRLQKALQENDEENSSLDGFTLETFENIAFTMARYADPSVPDDVDEWLDGFNVFSIYAIMPQLLELWGYNVEAQVQSKKNLNRLTAR